MAGDWGAGTFVCGHISSFSGADHEVSEHVSGPVCFVFLTILELDLKFCIKFGVYKKLRTG